MTCIQASHFVCCAARCAGAIVHKVDQRAIL